MLKEQYSTMLSVDIGFKCIHIMGENPYKEINVQRAHSIVFVLNLRQPPGFKWLKEDTKWTTISAEIHKFIFLLGAS